MELTLIRDIPNYYKTDNIDNYNNYILSNVIDNTTNYKLVSVYLSNNNYLAGTKDTINHNTTLVDCENLILNKDMSNSVIILKFNNYDIDKYKISNNLIYIKYGESSTRGYISIRHLFTTLKYLIFSDSNMSGIDSDGSTKNRKFNNDLTESNIKYIKYGKFFSSNIIQLPKSLKYLDLGYYYDEPLNKLNDNIAYLKISKLFKKQINENTLPKYLKYLINYTATENQTINILPKYLKYLDINFLDVQFKDNFILGKYIKKLNINIDKNSERYNPNLSIFLRYNIELNVNADKTYIIDYENIDKSPYLLKLHLSTADIDISIFDKLKYLKYLDIDVTSFYNDDIKQQLTKSLKYLSILTVDTRYFNINNNLHTLKLGIVSKIKNLPKYLNKLILEDRKIFTATFITQEELLNLPKYLTSLTFKNKNIIQLNTLPKYIKELIFNLGFNYELNKNMIPKFTRKLLFNFDNTNNYNLDILPKHLQYLKLNNNYNNIIRKGDLPKKLKYLYLGWEFDEDLYEGLLPNSIVYLHLGYAFSKELTRKLLPKSLKYLYLPNNYPYKDIVNSFNIPYVEYLEFKDNKQ